MRGVTSRSNRPPPRRIGRAAVAWAGLAASLLLDCTPDFDDPTTIKDLRVLAIEADLPETLIDSVPAPLPKSGEDTHCLLTGIPKSLPTVTLRPLIVDPKGAGRSLSITAWACPNDPTSGNTGQPGGGGVGSARGTINAGPCPPPGPGSATIALDAPDPSPPGFDFPFAPTPAFAASAFTSDPVGTIFGFPIDITLEVAAGGQSVTLLKRVLYVPRLTPEQTPNQNPVTPGVLVYARRGDDKLALDTATPYPVALGKTLTIEPEPAVAERYVHQVVKRGTETCAQEVVEKETLRYSFYATAGTFTPQGTSSEPFQIFEPGPVHLESTYHAPTVMPDDPHVTIFILVRDERGGVSHVERQLVLQ